jgi:hypothetical protein
MGISQPFKPIVLLAVGGLLLALTAVLLLVSLDLTAPPLAKDQSTRVVESTVGATEFPADEASPSVTLTSTLPVMVSSVEATATPVPEITRHGEYRPEKTATLPVIETAPSSSPSPDDEQSTPSPTPSGTGQGIIPLPEEWQRVAVPDLDISFDVPADWQRLGQEWAWSPDGTSVPRTGFVWTERKRPAEMLPGALTVVHQESLDLGWTEASSFRLERRQGDELVAAEWHVVVQLSDEFTGDFYASGRSLDELGGVELVLRHLLTTIAFRTAPEGPVETSIGFLSAVMRNPAGEEAQLFLSDSLRGTSPLHLLNIDKVYTSFVVTLLPIADGRIGVQATLNYPEGKAEQRMLLLIMQDEGWRIDEVNTAS